MRLFRPISLAIVLVLTFGCEEKQPMIEFDREKMVRVLTDLHIAEAALSQVTVGDRDSIGAVALEKVAEMHGMTQSEIEDQIVYLQGDPELMATVYEQILDTLDYFTANAETLSKVLKAEADKQSKPKNQQ